MKFKPILDIKPLPNPSLARRRLLQLLDKLSIKSARQTRRDNLYGILKEMYDIANLVNPIYKSNPFLRVK